MSAKNAKIKNFGILLREDFMSVVNVIHKPVLAVVSKKKNCWIVLSGLCHGGIYYIQSLQAGKQPELNAWAFLVNALIFYVYDYS